MRIDIKHGRHGETVTEDFGGSPWRRLQSREERIVMRIGITEPRVGLTEPRVCLTEPRTLASGACVTEPRALASGACVTEPRALASGCSHFKELIHKGYIVPGSRRRAFQSGGTGICDE
jgi:hypothetical protein